MNARNSPTPIVWRSIFAFLACVALAFGSVTPHDLAVDQAGGVSRVEIAESAVHPREPAHFEDAEIKVHPGCVACLLQLEKRTVLSHPPVPLPPLAHSVNAPAPVETASSRNVFSLGPARAPPVSSPSA